MHHPTHRITHTTAFVTPVVEHRVEREIAYTNSEILVAVMQFINSELKILKFKLWYCIDHFR